jgi:hypothetical protein
MSSIKRLVLALAFVTGFALIAHDVAPVRGQTTGGGGVTPGGGRGLTSSGGTTTGPILFPDGTATNPSIAFSAEPALGFRRASASTVYFANNVSAVQLGIGPFAGANSMLLNGGNTGMTLGSTVNIGWTGGHEQNAVTVNLSRISNGLLGVGTGAVASFAGGLKLTTLQTVAGTGTQIGVPSTTIFSSLTATGSTGGGAEADVSSFTMPANTLSSNGMTLRFFACGKHAANANSTTFRMYFAGTLVQGSSQTVTGSGDIVCGEFEITRTSSTTAILFGDAHSPTGTFTQGHSERTGLDFTAGIILKYSVQAATTTNDLIGQLMRVEWKSS